MKFRGDEKSKKYLHMLLVVGALLTASILKFWLILSDIMPFNSDEAVVALMARHILQGAKPIFFYGQAYMGSLDAWIVALGFQIFGEHVWVIRGVQTILYLGIMVSTYFLGRLALGSKKVGLLAIYLLAIPNVIVTLYTTVSIGGYGEAILIGNLNLIVGLLIVNRIHQEKSVEVWQWIFWGSLTGFGMWAFGISLVFSIPMGVFLLFSLWKMNPELSLFIKSWSTWRAVLYSWFGFFIGAIPLWIYAIQNELGVMLRELAGSAIAVEQSPWLQSSLQHFGRLILFGSTAVYGMRPSWEIRWLGFPLMPLILIFWISVSIYSLVRLRIGYSNRYGAALLLSTILVLGIGFTFTPFGVDPSGRYFVPMIIPLSLFAAEMTARLAKKNSHWACGLIGLVLVYNFWGIYASVNWYPPGITTQFNPITQVDSRYLDELVCFLEAQGETRGYTNYWVAYPLAFLSEERLIFIPRLPYHEDLRFTERDDRYAPYREIVESAGRIAYITTHHPVLNDIIRETFTENNISWKENEIGDYLIFFHLSDTLRPDEFGIISR